MTATRRTLFALVAGGLLAAAVAPASAQIVIREHAMPALRVEVVPVSPPHPGWSWVKGHWRWADRAHDWVWAPGRWVEHGAPMPELVVETPPPPPSPRHFWVRGHWAWEGNHWQWMRGHWVA